MKEQYAKRKTKGLRNDIDKIKKNHFRFVENLNNDPEALFYATKMEKTLLIRSLIVETHLAIEDFINSLLQISLLKRHPRIKKEKGGITAKNYFNNAFEDASSIFYGNNSMGFKKKIILLRIMGVINKRLYEDLDILNTLRNKCSHNWEIESVIRRKIKRDKSKKYVLIFKGKSLFDPKIMINFLDKYNDVLLKIAKKY
ncbi:MAG: hypothetical protein WC519_01790 [Parcubacteria group bacterium]